MTRQLWQLSTLVTLDAQSQVQYPLCHQIHLGTLSLVCICCKDCDASALHMCFKQHCVVHHRAHRPYYGNHQVRYYPEVYCTEHIHSMSQTMYADTV